MKKTTLFLILLVIFSMLLIAGCTQPVVKPATTPTSTPAVTAVQTIVQNQGGVAIIRTITVNATPTVVPTTAIQPNMTVEAKTNQTAAAAAVMTNKS